MESLQKIFQLLLFICKIGIGLFDKCSDLLYFFNQHFQYEELKDGMFFFLILSPTIQIIAWSMLFAQIKIDLPKPSISDRVKQSRSIRQFICNFIISFLEYYIHLLWLMLKHMPISLGITILQEIKIFPFCLFGFTYYKYKTILTKDMMKNLAAHLMLLEQIDDDHEVLEENNFKGSPLPQNPLFRDESKENNQQGLHLQNQLERIESKESKKNEFLFKQNNLQIPSGSISLSPTEGTSNILPKKIINLQQVQLIKQPSLLINGEEDSGQTDRSSSPVLQRAILKNQLNINDNNHQQIEIFCQNEVKQEGGHLWKKKNTLTQPLFTPQSQGSPQKKYFPHILESNEGEKIESQGDESQGFSLFPILGRKQSITFNQPLRMNKKYSHRQSTFFKHLNDTIQEGNNGQPIKNRSREQSISKKPMEGLEKSTISNLFKMSMFYKRQSKDVPLNKFQPINLASPNSSIFSQVTYKNSRNICNETDLLLDANIVPNLEIFLTDQNLESFLLITDVIEAIFEALPMTVLQYVNNGINGSWTYSDGSYNIFLLLSFFTSLVIIIWHGISLLKILYDDDIKIFYCTLQFLKKFNVQNNNEIKKENLSKSKLPSTQVDQNTSAEGFGRIFPMSSEIIIEKLIQLKKLTVLRKQACNEITSIKYLFNDDPFYAQSIHDNIYKSITDLKKLQKLQIQFERNNFIFNQSPLIYHIICDLPDISYLNISFSDNFISEEFLQKTYHTLNSWVFKKEGKVEELLFKSESLFIWRCTSFKKVYHNKANLFLENFESLCSSSSNKIIVEILLLGKVFNQEEIEDLTDSIQAWNRLQHFQLIVDFLPQLHTDSIIETLSQSESLISSLVATTENGLLYRKGFNFNYSQKENIFELTNQMFFLNLDALQFIFQKGLGYISSSNIEKSIIAIETSKDNIQHKLKYQSAKYLMKLISSFKGMHSLEFKLKDNDLNHDSGEILGECIQNLKSLKEIYLDISNNKFGSIGFSQIMQKLIKGQQKFQEIFIDVSTNQIMNEGILSLINFIKLLGEQPSLIIKRTLNLTKLLPQNNNSINIIIDEEKECYLQRLVLDLSNNGLERNILNDLFEAVSLIPSLKQICLKLSENQVNVTKQFDFSQLKCLEELQLTFENNVFSTSNIDNLFNSFKSLSSKLSSFQFKLINNNLTDKITTFSQSLCHLINIKLFHLSLRNNGLLLTKLFGFQQFLTKTNHLQNLHLDFSKCNFGQIGVDEIFNKNLLLLSLEKADFNFSENHEFNNECSKMVIEAMQRLPRLSSLLLNYEDTAITDQSVFFISKKIVAMIQLRQVTFNFLNNKTTDAALRFIVEGLISSKHIQQPHFNI